MESYDFFYNDNTSSYLQIGGLESKTRVIKLLSSGDANKMEQELAGYLPLLKSLLENSSVQESRQMLMYVFAQVSAVAVICGVDDWHVHDVQKDFYLALDNVQYVEDMLTICHDFIMAFVESIYQQKVKKDYSFLVQEICKYIYYYMDERITLTRIANHFHFSESYIAHKFKKETGLSIGDYILECRIEEAKILLNSDIPISQISTQLGFNSQSHFTKAFRSKTGMSPREWRKEISLVE